MEGLPHFQPKERAALPARIGAPKPPRLCAMFHMPQYVPLSFVANQDVRIRAQQGPPKPCQHHAPLQRQQEDEQSVAPHLSMQPYKLERPDHLVVQP